MGSRWRIAADHLASPCQFCQGKSNTGGCEQQNLVCTYCSVYLVNVYVRKSRGNRGQITCLHVQTSTSSVWHRMFPTFDVTRAIVRRAWTIQCRARILMTTTAVVSTAWTPSTADIVLDSICTRRGQGPTLVPPTTSFRLLRRTYHHARTPKAFDLNTCCPL